MKQSQEVQHVQESKSVSVKSDSKGNQSAIQFGHPMQLMANSSQRIVQLRSMQQLADQTTVQRQVNNTGLPDNLKSGIENLSGYSMNDVKVHYNSDKPAQLNAHAYAQGTNIHLASGQEKHLPHEAWHVVQQKQGRVQPTRQLKGKVAINDDAGLEREADVMGEKALGFSHEINTKLTYSPTQLKMLNQHVFQRKKWSTGKLDGKESNIDWKTKTIGGDEVGVEMTAKLLGPDHPQGTPPKSGAQKNLMNKLPTDPSLSNENKYIRGHLLNDNLGGEGEPYNLFPITANANKEHERVIEHTVKKWVNDERQWVFYQVKVNNIVDKSNNGYVDAELDCQANVLDPVTLNPINSISAKIVSDYKNVKIADVKNAKDDGKRGTVGSQAKLHKVSLSTSKKLKEKLDEETMVHLVFLFSEGESARLLKAKLLEYEGIGKATVNNLESISEDEDMVDVKVMSAIQKVLKKVGGNELMDIISDTYDEYFS
jgi:Domain of unknown function (DUF4157)/DNA/RNA non-specific endonuclease